MDLLIGQHRYTDTENRFLDTAGEEGGMGGRVALKAVYFTICKETANGKLPYNTGPQCHSL